MYHLPASAPTSHLRRGEHVCASVSCRSLQMPGCRCRPLRRRCKAPPDKPVDRAEARLRSGSAMLPGWRSQQKSAQRQNRQGEVSQAGANGNTRYSALLAFRSDRAHRYMVRTSVKTRCLARGDNQPVPTNPAHGPRSHMTMRIRLRRPSLSHFTCVMVEAPERVASRCSTRVVVGPRR